MCYTKDKPSFTAIYGIDCKHNIILWDDILFKDLQGLQVQLAYTCWRSCIRWGMGAHDGLLNNCEDINYLTFSY